MAVTTPNDIATDIANPTLSPSDAAVQEKSTIEALSGYAHKDAFGNPIGTFEHGVSDPPSRLLFLTACS